MFAHVRPDDRRQVQLVSTLSSAWEDLRTGLDEWGSRKAKAEDKRIKLFDQGGWRWLSFSQLSSEMSHLKAIERRSANAESGFALRTFRLGALHRR